MLTSYRRYGDYICMGEDLMTFSEYAALGLVCFIAILFVINVLLIKYFAYEGVDAAKILFNPYYMYIETKRVNIFGAILACIVHNICFILPALWFWIYFICTAGKPE